MGGGLAHQALEKGVEVAGVTVGDNHPDLLSAGLTRLSEYSEFKSALRPPRKLFLYVPAGQVVDRVISQLQSILEPGDVIVDGGNSYWRDSIARFTQLKPIGIEFIDMGTSGGPEGARRGACFMVGGEGRSIEKVWPILKALSLPGALVHAGPPGAGHFVKLVHNGIEFGMMQAIGEGLDLLERSDVPIDVEHVLQCWRHGTVIRSWLIDLLAESYRRMDSFENVEGYVEDTGEVNWLVEDAARMEVPIPVISQSVWQLILSRDQQKNWAKAIAAMRNGFGEHPFGRSEKIANIRRTSRSRI